MIQSHPVSLPFAHTHIHTLSSSSSRDHAPPPSPSHIPERERVGTTAKHQREEGREKRDSTQLSPHPTQPTTTQPRFRPRPTR